MASYTTTLGSDYLGANIFSKVYKAVKQLDPTAKTSAVGKIVQKTSVGRVAVKALKIGGSLTPVGASFNAYKGIKKVATSKKPLKTILKAGAKMVASTTIPGAGLAMTGAQALSIAAPKTYAKASKTVSRFDPTSRTAKYRNVSRGIIAGTALGVATALTGGGAAAIAGAAGTGLTAFFKGGKPVVQPPDGSGYLPPSGSNNYVEPAMQNTADQGVVDNLEAQTVPAEPKKSNLGGLLKVASIAAIAYQFMG